ncbi:MAG: sulfotransferase [Pseudomonadota bacterium]
MALSESSCPVFVLYGALRSGTTLLRLILRAHPQIHSAHENDFFLDHLHTTAEGVRLDVDGLSQDWVFRKSGLKVPSTTDGQAAFEDLLAQHCGTHDGPTVLVLHRGLGRLLDRRPEIPVIHLIRDPRDVARSSIGMGWVGTAWHGVRHWLRTERDWDLNAGRMPLVCTVYYEDLVRDPVQELTRICAFLGLSYDEAMMNYVETSTYSAIDPAMAEQWRRKMTPRDIALVEHEAGELLESRGYAASGHPVTSPQAIERFKLNMRNRIGTWRTRTRRYGWMDPVSYGIAKRLGMRRIQQQIKSRLDAKRHSFLK